jgi:hypothetical protein
MKKSKIAKFARMASNEAHEEYMSLNSQELSYYAKDLLSEIIDKFLNNSHRGMRRPGP